MNVLRTEISGYACQVQADSDTNLLALQVLEGAVGCLDWGLFGPALGVSVGQVSSAFWSAMSS